MLVSKPHTLTHTEDSALVSLQMIIQVVAIESVIVNTLRVSNYTHRI